MFQLFTAFWDEKPPSEMIPTFYKEAKRLIIMAAIKLQDVLNGKSGAST